MKSTVHKASCRKKLSGKIAFLKKKKEEDIASRTSGDNKKQTSFSEEDLSQSVVGDNILKSLIQFSYEDGLFDNFPNKDRVF